MDFAEEKGKWKYRKDVLQIDSIRGVDVLNVDAENCWPLAFRDSLKNLVSNKTKHLEVEFDLRSSDSLFQLVLVMELKKGEELIAWRGLNTKDYPFRLNKWNSVCFSMDLQELIPIDEDFQNLVFNTYLWNQSENNFEIANSCIWVLEGNPLRYALFKKIEE